MSPDLLVDGDRGDRGADRPPVRRQPDHHAPAAAGAGRGLPRPQGRPCRAGRRPAAGRRASPRIKQGGAKVMCFAPALVIAKKLVRSGADAIVIEGMEAGGHIGPVSTSVLAQEILPAIREVPVFVAGGIGRGEAILGYLEMGASGCQLGTRFVCATESIAHPKFKQAFIRASARDAVPSVQLDPRFPGDPRARARQRRRRERFTRRPARGDRPRRSRRDRPEGGAAGDRAFLGRRPAPRRHRRRCRERLADGRPERRHGHRASSRLRRSWHELVDQAVAALAARAHVVSAAEPRPR